MKSRISDLIYSARSLCEALHDRSDILEHDDELKDIIDDVEGCLDELTDSDEDTE